MNEEIEFLDYIYQNAKMGQESVARLLKTRNKQDEIEEVMKELYQDYKKISNSAKGMIERRKKKVKEIGVMSKIGTFVSIKKNLLNDDSPQEIAKMMIETSKTGVEDILKHREDYKIKSKNVENLADRFLAIENNNIEKLQQYV